MPRRRKVLIGLGGSIAIAGCSGDTDDEELESDPEPEPEPEEEAEEEQSAKFEFVSATPSEMQVNSDETTIEVIVVNNGGIEGTDTIEIIFEEEIISTEKITLEPNEQTTIGISIDSYEREFVEYTFGASSSDDEIFNNFIATVPPVEEPENISKYNIEGKDDVSFNGVKRFDLDISINTEEEKRFLHENSKQEVLDICKDIILDLTSEEHVNAISFNFWRSSQTIGAEMAHGVIDWAPDGNWSEANTVETGDYTSHDFRIGGVEYVKTVRIDAPDEVEGNEEFTVDFIVENMGLVDASVSGIIEDIDDTVYEEFDINLSMGENTKISSGKIEADFFAVNSYTLTATGADRLYGYNRAQIWRED